MVDFRANARVGQPTGDDQACHRRHREGQAVDEEGLMEGWANERRRPPQQCGSR